MTGAKLGQWPLLSKFTGNYFAKTAKIKPCKLFGFQWFLRFWFLPKRVYTGVVSVSENYTRRPRFWCLCHDVFAPIYFVLGSRWQKRILATKFSWFVGAGWIENQWSKGKPNGKSHCISMRGLKAQKHLAQGNALGLHETWNARPVRAKAL